jgi:hypothetical protein
MKDSDLKLQHVDFDLFAALEALDRKDYGYFDTLTEEQQKKFVPYMMLHWVSSIKKQGEVGKYYVLATEEFANKHIFNEYVQRHPKLQWLMLCIVSPDMGKQFHQWIPQLSNKISELRVQSKPKDYSEYLSKIYNTADTVSINELSKELSMEQNKKYLLAQLFPAMKSIDIDNLSKYVTDEELADYARQCGT